MAEVIAVVGNVVLVKLKLVAAFWVFSAAVAGLDFAIVVLVDFSGDMVVWSPPESLRRDVRYGILVVSDAGLALENGLRECSVLFISHSRLTEVDHGGGNTVFLERHGG